jgi:hypothetical protein
MLVHTFIMGCTCHPGMCHLIMTSFSWSTDFVKYMPSFHDYVSFSITIQTLGHLIWSIDHEGYMSAVKLLHMHIVGQ